MTDIHDMIDALIDGTIEAGEIITLGSAMSEDAGVRALVERALWQQRKIAGGAKCLSEVAARIDVPARRVAGREPQRVRMRARLVPCTGWAAAAVLAIVLALPFSGATNERPDAMTMPVALTTDEAFAEYIAAGLERGDVIQELLPQTLRIEPTNGDRVEVTFVRRILEKRSVEDLYRFGQDEHGRIVAVRVPATTVSKQQSL